MTIFATLADHAVGHQADEVLGERHEFLDRPAAEDWFDRYLSGFTTDSDPSISAELTLYNSATGEQKITTLSAKATPNLSHRIIDKMVGDRIGKGYNVSGLDIVAASGGYLTAHLVQMHLLEEFGAADVPVAYRNAVIWGLHYIAGSHPLATRMWLAGSNSHEFGRMVFLEQTTTGLGFSGPHNRGDLLADRLSQASGAFSPAMLYLLLTEHGAALAVPGEN